MNEILDFMLKHWQLSGLFLLLLSAYLLYELKEEGNSKTVTPDKAIELFNHQDGVIVDIRTQEAFKAGHIVGAIQVDVNDSDIKLKKLNKFAKNPVIVVSTDGKSAAKFATRLERQGLARVLSLAGGLNAWQSAGLPLIKQ